MIHYLRDDLLKTDLNDNIKGRFMLPDGNYERPKPPPANKALNSQLWLLNRHQRGQKS
jgi:hypothetical protein